MLNFAWRWAEVGDNVLLHDRYHPERDLMSGVIAVVNRVKGDTSIGVRVDENGITRWVWPTPLFLHPAPLDPAESCRICDEHAAHPAPRTSAAHPKELIP